MFHHTILMISISANINIGLVLFKYQLTIALLIITIYGFLSIENSVGLACPTMKTN